MSNLTKFPGKGQVATFCSRSMNASSNILNTRMRISPPYLAPIIRVYSLNTIVSNMGPELNERLQQGVSIKVVDDSTEIQTGYLTNTREKHYLIGLPCFLYYLIVPEKSNTKHMICK
jgi:hypothetical protein